MAAYEGHGHKSADRVIAYIIGRLFDGSLRPGDRIDRNDVADALGLSRLPVHEALGQLNRDGVVQINYRRGAFVGPFDAETIREHYELRGYLSGLAAARFAANPQPESLAALESYVQGMRKAATSQEFDDLAEQFHAVIRDVATGPRLRALLTSFVGFVPNSFRVLWPNDTRTLLPTYEAEYEAFARRDPRAASQAVIHRSSVLADAVVHELVRRGIIAAEHPEPIEQLQTT